MNPARRPPALLEIQPSTRRMDHRRHGGDPTRFSSRRSRRHARGERLRRLRGRAGGSIARRDAVSARPRCTASLHQGRRRLGGSAVAATRRDARDACARPAASRHPSRRAGGAGRLSRAGRRDSRHRTPRSPRTHLRHPGVRAATACRAHADLTAGGSGVRPRSPREATNQGRAAGAVGDAREGTCPAAECLLQNLGARDGSRLDRLASGTPPAVS